MSLSISNFKFGFVFKVLFVCIAMMILYAFFIFFFKPEIFTGMNQWQDNIIRAENYIYEEYRKPIVIAGSSLSARLRR